jgi:hypothetical protein
MGFVLSVLYLLICYLTPVTLFGTLGLQFRIELIVAALIFAISVIKMRSFVFRTPQALALTGLAVAVFLSVLIGVHWPGGATAAIVNFIPGIYAFFVIGLHCDSRRKLNVLVLMLLFACLFVIAQGCLELTHTNSPEENKEVLPGEIPDTVTLNGPVWNAEHPYLIAQQAAPWEWIYRIRGLGIINDPNDFGQLLVSVTPLLFILWKPKKFIRNFAFVLVPACLLLYGIFLTHSRGALVALVAVVVVAARRRIGTVPAVVVAGALFAGAMALQFTGGRAISADAGSDRTALWGGSLQLLKSHPIFGVGYGQLSDLIGQTAHNSVVVCAAELGLFGLFFWTLFLLPTVRDVYMIAMPKKVGQAVNAEAVEVQPSLNAWSGTALSKSEISHIGYCLLLSLTGFLAAGWFLSRAFTITFFLIGGMVEVVYEAARRQGMVASRMPLKRTLIYTSVLTICLVTIVYVTLRLVNLNH